MEEASWVTKRLSPRAMRRLSSSRNSFRSGDVVDDPKSKIDEENASSFSSSSSLQAAA